MNNPHVVYGERPLRIRAKIRQDNTADELYEYRIEEPVKFFEDIKWTRTFHLGLHLSNELPCSCIILMMTKEPDRKHPSIASDWNVSRDRWYVGGGEYVEGYLHTRGDEEAAVAILDRHRN